MADTLRLCNPGKPTEACKGLVYRCRINSYVTNRGDVTTKTIASLLKRKSCNLCCAENTSVRRCLARYMLSELKEFFAADEIVPSMPEGAVDGCLLKLQCSFDNEGIIEDMWFELINEDEAV